MARIRLKNCYVRFLDGFRGSAKVAAGASPAAGATTLAIDSYASTFGALPLGTRFTIDGVAEIYTITAKAAAPTAGAVNDLAIGDGDTTLGVDSITGRVPVGATFTIDGVTGTFTVTATTETGNDTTELTFTPALAAGNLPVDDAVITFTNATAINSITISPPLAAASGLPTAGDDLVITGRCLNIKVGDGNVSWDETLNYEYEMDRGHIDAVVEGDDEPLSVTLDMVYEFVTAVTGSGVPTPEDVLKRRGEAADWITTGADACEPFAVDLEIDHQPPCDDEHEITTFPEFRWDNVAHDIGQASLNVRARCNVIEPTTIRRAY